MAGMRRGLGECVLDGEGLPARLHRKLALPKNLRKKQTQTNEVSYHERVSSSPQTHAVAYPARVRKVPRVLFSALRQASTEAAAPLAT